jgi:hypothetical protein
MSTPTTSRWNSTLRAVPKPTMCKPLRGSSPCLGLADSGLVLLYEIQDIQRFPRVQDFVSYCRLVKCAKGENSWSR